MKNNLAPVHYSVPAEDTAESLKKKLEYYADQINRQWGKASLSMLEIGKLLSEVRDLLGNNKKALEEWVGKTFAFSIRSAYNHIKNYETFGCSAQCALMEDSAMTVLASNIEATKTAKKMIAQGTKINHAKAIEIVAKCNPKPPRIEAAKIEDAEFTVVASAPEAASDESGKDDSTDAQAKEEAQETAPRPTRNVKEKPGDVPKDLGKCPVCAGTKFDDRSGTGLACSKCHHPHGCETGGDRDENDDKRASDQKAKTRKTIEALMRAYDDLNVMSPKPREHADAIATCKVLLNSLKAW